MILYDQYTGKPLGAELANPAGWNAVLSIDHLHQISRGVVNEFLHFAFGVRKRRQFSQGVVAGGRRLAAGILHGQREVLGIVDRRHHGIDSPTTREPRADEHDARRRGRRRAVDLLNLRQIHLIGRVGRIGGVDCPSGVC
jgi:hypothetical protein